MSRPSIPILGAILVSALLLTGCAPEAGPEAGSGANGTSTTPETTNSSETPTTPEETPVTQEQSCGWETPRIESGSSSDVPSTTGAPLETALIGAWQHTHTDTGAGFEALKPTTDIRFVFPSTTTLLYCQDVTGATSQAERVVSMQLDDATLVVPSPASGYTVTAWNSDTMVWTNLRDGSLYLLKRR
jgi:hypothetical protein